MVRLVIGTGKMIDFVVDAFEADQRTANRKRKISLLFSLTNII